MAVRFEISCGFINNMGKVDGENSKVLQKFASPMEESIKLNCTGMKLMVSEERKLK